MLILAPISATEQIPRMVKKAKRISVAEIGARMSTLVDPNVLHENLESLGFSPSLAKPKMGKEVGRRRTRS